MGSDFLIQNIQLFTLIFVRIFALISIAPLLSSAGIPPIAKVGLAMFTGIVIFPWVAEQGYLIPDSGLAYGLLLIGEILIGLILGFMLTVIYSAFLLSGQLYSMQMGFGASQVYDPLAQIQIPLMGQFVNLMAMFIFVINGGFQKIFLMGVLRSFETIKAVDLINVREPILKLVLRSMSILFEQALVIAFPILGVLLLISVSMGLLAKAAPQMNLLMLGFPIKITMAFLMLFLAMPFLLEAFTRVIDSSFYELMNFLKVMSGGSV
ncbi:MAG: flagellar biosynthetic protein FliR [Spirochaetes bacterium]|nr:MAG: flagellar biosynthetic protein FliR [Spirochaetota bacterium]